MKNSTIKVLCKVLCIVLLAAFALEAPLYASHAAINVDVGGQNIAVTPGQWVTVNNGPMTTHYNVRYVNGQPMALEMSQYMNLVFGAEGAGAAAQAGTAAQQAAAPVAQTSKAAVQSSDSAKVVKTGSSGSWIKDEVSAYGQNIKDSFQSGQESGQAFGTKTVDTVKTGAEKVGGAATSVGSKIGDLLSSAKEKISNLFSKKPVATKGGTAKQSGDAAQQSGDSAQQSGGAAQQSGDSAQQSGDSAQQSGGAAQQSGDSAQQSGGAAQQSGDSAQQSGKVVKGDDGKGGFLSNLKDTTSTNFKSGYEAGKAMTNQGVQNVKDSLSTGFSAKNILMTAGITVGVDLATQLMSGQRPSLTKAVKTVVSAEFAGGVVGSVTGAAAGSFFVPFLSAVPVVGGVLSALAPTFGSVVGGSVGAYLAGDLRNGRFSIKEAFKGIDWTSVAGQTIGSTAGAALGSMIFPPFGTIIGGIAGGMVGRWAANKIADLFGGKTSFGSIGMPVGSNPFGGAPVSQVSGPISIGAVAGGGEIAISGSANAPTITIAGSAAEMGTYSSEVQLAEAKYTELYKLYNEMLTQGRQDDAIKVAQEMNKAKAEFETLRAQSNK